MLKPFRGVSCSEEEKITKTLNNGYLGSRNDEERSEMRYVVRIAGCKRVIESLNAYCARGSGRGHVCLSVSRYPQLHLLGGRWSWPSRGRFVGRAGRLKRSGAPRPPKFLGFGLSVVVSGMLPALFRRVCPVNAVPGVSRRELGFLRSRQTLLHLLTSDQARLPAEFKHITKRRKRN